MRPERLLRKTTNRCVLCGRQDKRTSAGLTCCEECSQSAKDNYVYNRNKRAKRHACTRCGMIDRYTRDGKSMCSDCRKAINERRARLRAERESEHRCVECGAELGDSAGKTCGECLNKRKARRKNASRE